MTKSVATNSIIILLAALLFTAQPICSNAQTNIETYGQNRVQYRKFDWKFFDTKHFRVYYYDRSGTALARYVSEQAERDVLPLERRLGGQFPKRFNIILYNNYDEYRQTNIGLKNDNQQQDAPAGMVNLVDDKLVIYFDGVHTDLHRQIRLGLTQVLMGRLLFGENFREMVKNTLLLNLPQWVSDGYISYLVDGWDPASESKWKNVIDAHGKDGFFRISDKYPELAGKAFWKYISDHFGEHNIKTLLYSMQYHSSLNQGIKMTLGMKVQDVYDSCMAYYRNVFTKDSLKQETPDIKDAMISIPVPKDNTVLYNINVSPKGHDVAYVEFKEGEYKVYIQHTDHQQARSLVMEEGQKDFNEKKPDPDYPIMAWSNNGYKLAIMYRHGTHTRLRIYNSLKARIENYGIPPNRFDRVLGMTFNEDDDKIIFSAVRKSQTDLYAFAIKGFKLTNITNDAWDDVQPAFVSGGSKRGILFLSNRPAPNLNVPAEVNELPSGPMNVYFYDTKTQSSTLLQCSRNKGNDNITQPIQYGSENFAYLLDSNGIQNKYVVVFKRSIGNMDSAVSIPVTNYSRSILNHQYNAAARQQADVLQMGDQYKIFFRDLFIPQINTEPKILTPTTLSQTTGSVVRLSSIPQIPSSEQASDNEPIVKRGGTFQSEFSDSMVTRRNYSPRRAARHERTAIAEDTDLILNPLIKDSTYLKLKSQRYRFSFKPDFVSLRLDNTVLFTQYQSTAYNGGGSSYQNPPLSAMLSVNLNDALENQRFSGGIRLPVNLSGMTYFFQYQNFTRRVDWGLTYYRTSTKYDYNVTYVDSSGNPVLQTPELGRVTTNLIQAFANLPLDRIQRIGMTLGLRRDVLDFLSQDTLSLSFSPKQSQYWMMSRVEYDFDNSISPVTNIRNGFRYKIYGEYMYGLNEVNKGGFFNLGLDFRYYKKLYKNSIFAIRIAGAHSEGNKHVLYFLGGVDNWIGPKTANTPASTDQNYAFQALATNLRGYEQGARNGNSYGVTNIEVRVPVLTTIFDRPIQSAFLRSLQVIGFTDIGAAWNGLLPTDDNMARTYNLSSPTTPVSLQVASQNTGKGAMGYGAGIRGSLLGYFLRLDAAWNIDGRTKPLMYFSIGTDF